DDRSDPGGQDRGGQQVQCVLLIAHHHRVARVVAAVELDDPIGSFAEQVCRLAFALVAPLDADDHDSWHGCTPWYCTLFAGFAPADELARTGESILSEGVGSPECVHDDLVAVDPHGRDIVTSGCAPLRPSRRSPRTR